MSERLQWLLIDVAAFLGFVAMICTLAVMGKWLSSRILSSRRPLNLSDDALRPMDLSDDTLRPMIVKAMELDSGEPAQIAMSAMIVLADLLNEAMIKGQLFGTFTSLDDNGDLEYVVKIAALKPGEGPHYSFERKS